MAYVPKHPIRKATRPAKRNAKIEIKSTMADWPADVPYHWMAVEALLRIARRPSAPPSQ